MQEMKYLETGKQEAQEEKKQGWVTYGDLIERG